MKTVLDLLARALDLLEEFGDDVEVRVVGASVAFALGAVAILRVYAGVGAVFADAIDAVAVGGVNGY